MFFLRSLTPKVSQRFLSLGKTYWKEIGDPSTLTTLWPLEPQRRVMSLFKGAKEANNRPKEDLLKAQFWGMSRICPHTGSGISKPKKPGVSRSTLLFAMKDTIRSVTRKIGLRKRFWIRPVFHQQSKGFCPQPSGRNFRLMRKMLRRSFVKPLNSSWRPRPLKKKCLYRHWMLTPPHRGGGRRGGKKGDPPKKLLAICYGLWWSRPPSGCPPPHPTNYYCLYRNFASQ